MRLLFRVLASLLGLTALTVLLGAGLAYYLAARSLPDYEARWTVSGVAGPVEIVRDLHAVPHIFAESDADAMFALGWAHAQDRLWQMELGRRAAQGRLAELFGPDALPVDRSMRALELPAHAREAVAMTSPETRALMEAYAEGVNARIRAVNEGALGRGAPEFFLFGEDGLAPWTPTDSMSVVKLMALRLTGAAAIEARRARLLAQVTPEQLADLDPVYPDDGVIALPAYADLRSLGPVRHAHAPRAPHPLSPFAEADSGGASNVWAVDASRAAAGAPLLAADPHLWLSAPGVWHLARLSSPGFDAIGAGIPGIPAILIGRNGSFGWGLASAHVDDQDIYLERLNPDDPSQYLTPEGWAPLRTRTERIGVRGGGVETLRLVWTRHGPVPPAGGELDFSSITPPGHVAALAWTALSPRDGAMDAAIAMMRARTLEEGAAAAALHTAPAQNVVMADATGVGMVTAGVAPLRRADSRTRGRTPSLGWLPENDWQGPAPADASPGVLRPESGAVANANNRTTDAPFPLHLSFDWAAPYRIRRIESRLNERPFHTRDSFMELQNDAVSDMARGVLPLIARDLWWGEAQNDGPAAVRREAALARLADWNGAMSPHDPEPLIFTAWMRALTRRLAEDELGPLFREIAGPRPLFVERVYRDIDGAARWCDVVKTPERETCADMARRALDDALGELTQRYGEGPTGWRWGAAHVATHVHAPLGYAPVLGTLVNIEHESGGGDHTIMMGQSPGRGPNPDANIHAAGLRVVYDFAELDRSVMIVATGQSGHPLSRHYDDQSELWRRGDYIAMSLAPEDARAGAQGTTVLTPER
ncbi:penicillin acylase family protein [Rubrimonas cliftonensis]|uniref:Penicillin amidase n=1 Tax=Rubrimonas cliftonensis TaxID=89524 RepID=A0A1H4BBV1_9RHOB|nr:penicillin acylase family protein [Rubrimonas cliftonensis]SEA45524.1 penicillin amidase [Rubrimonas cliftonensis]